jgi:ankyrin repeat protein
VKFLFLLLILSLTSLQAETNTAQEVFKKAVSDGNLKPIETLLTYGFNPNQSVNGYTPLYFAIQLNQTNVVELLLAGHADPNALVDRVNTASPGNMTPLQFAVQVGNLQIASRLIGAGAHIDSKGAAGRTALHYAARSNHLDMIRFLIDRGADPNLRDKEGASPLDDAVWSGSLDAAAILLAHGARLNEPDTQTGATPISEAAFLGRTALVQYLLQFHPDLAIQDKRGYSALDNAVRMRKQESAVSLLEAEPKEQQTPEFFAGMMAAAIPKDESAVVEALLRQGALANGLFASGSAPLDVAASAGALNVVRVLLDHGADPNLSGKNGVTALEDASLKGFDSIVRALVDHGAVVDRLNGDSGTTALYAAASFGKSEVVKLLLEHGANPGLCGKNRKTPYQAALENGYGDVATLIQNHGGAKNCGH